MTKREWLAAGVLALAMTRPSLAAAEETMEARIEALEPKLEAYIASGMKAFDDPGLAIGIVTGDKLVYAKGFGVGRKGGAPVDPDTIFQIGSTTKAFLATTLAIGVDRKLFKWDDRVVDLYPEFQLKDPWVTPGVPRLRPPRAALRAAALRQRLRRPARLRPAGDDPLAALRRAGVELPLHLRLYQHHPHGRRPHRGEGLRRGGLGGRWLQADHHRAARA